MAPRHVTEFVQQLTPMAVEIGDRYGIDPALIITQAAIESGWGQNVSGNNYFGVKSHGKPGGQTITTHEEIDGKRVKVQDSFRVYDSLAGSMEDYARFLSENPRYGDVFKSRDLDKQIAAIADSGYATDSKYPGLLRDVSRMVKSEMWPMPPAQIPNVVASQLDTTPQINVPLPKPRPTTRQSAEASVRPYLTADMQVRGDNLPSLLPAQITPGMGSLTPDFFRSLPQQQPQTRNVPLPRLDPRQPNRMDLAAPALPNIQRRLPDIGSTSSSVGPGPTSLATVQDMYGRPSGIGQPPTTRSVPSVPVRPSMDPIGHGPDRTFFEDMFSTQLKRPTTAAALPVLPSAIPGVREVNKMDDQRLAAGIYPMAPGGVGVGTQLSTTPPLPRPRPNRTLVSVTMPTPVSQRPNPNALRVTVNGAGSYSGGGSSQPSAPQTITGSSTGKTYNVGQQYQAGGYRFVATPDGFKNLGRV